MALTKNDIEIARASIIAAGSSGASKIVATATLNALCDMALQSLAPGREELVAKFAEAIYGSFATYDRMEQEYYCVHCEVTVDIDAWQRAEHTRDCIVREAASALANPGVTQD